MADNNTNTNHSQLIQRKTLNHRRLAVALLAALLAGCASKPAPLPAEPPVPVAKRSPRIGLALGGGAAAVLRTWA